MRGDKGHEQADEALVHIPIFIWNVEANYLLRLQMLAEFAGQLITM
jgi:hypothetical protein